MLSGEQNRPSSGKLGFVATSDANIEALLHWWNYLHSSSELKFTAAYGAPGEDKRWIMAEDGMPTATGIKESDEQFTDMIHSGPAYNVSEYRTVEQVEGSEGWLREVTVEKFMDNIPAEGFSTRFVPAELVEERAMIEVELFEYLNSFVASSIMDGVTDESWQAHLKQLEVLGYYDWIQWYQDVEDGKF